MIIALILIALVLFLLEIFMPGGILAILGLGCLLGASYFAYVDYGSMAAILTFLGACALALLCFYIEMKLLKNTVLGKFLRSEGAIKAASNNPQGDESLVGQTGTALTTMAPSGRVRIGDRNYEAASMGGYVQKNATVEVVRVENFKLIIKAL